MSSSPTGAARVARRVLSIAARYAVLGALGLSLGALVSRPGTAAADETLPTWTTSDLDLGGDFSSSSVAVDGDGAAHACSNTGAELVYATDATGSWTYTVIDATGTGLTYASAIAIDADGAVHLAYDGFESLAYATDASGAWVTTTVHDPGYDVGDDVSLALDSNGDAHVACLDRTNGHLLYATNASGTWAVSDLGSYPGSGGYTTSIAVDGADAIHIVHSRYVPSPQMLWTTDASGDWVTTPLGGTSGNYNSVKADALGYIHVSFFDGSVYYGTNASGTWLTTLIDDDVGISAHSSLVLDSAGRVHITYGDYAEHDLQYATNSLGADPADWDLQLVDGDGNKGYRSSLALDADGDLHVVYSDRDEGGLRYGTTRPPLEPLDCAAVARQDGWILESRPGRGVGRRSNGRARTLVVGDDRRKRQYRSILSFRTGDIPEGAVIVSATLRLRRRTVRGADPFDSLGALIVDVGGPGFGPTPALRRTDFQADAGTPAAGTLTATGDDGVYEAPLSTEALEQIDRDGFTQFRLAFETATDGDRAADRAVFWSGSARPAARRPVLEVEYRMP